MSAKCPKCNTDNPANLKYCGECGTQLLSVKEIAVTETLEIPREELTTGSIFAGRYQIIEELGKGGMGKVYKAHDEEVTEKVALKLIKSEIAADKKTIERFRNELKIARKVRHKNVCQMYDLGTEKGTYYITMEYIVGEDLKKLIRKMGRLSEAQAVSLAKQVCAGLAEAHKIGVVHRDLKPQNIMVDDEGNARIMDFGIARTLDAKGITGVGMMIGTPEYMSPEQVEGKEIDQRSDIYSLGVVMYEMVTGQVPFEGDTPFAIGTKHKSESPKDPQELNVQLRPELSRAILKCLEKEKDKRHKSVMELAADLDRVEKAIPTTEKAIFKKKPKAEKGSKVNGKKFALYGGASVLLIMLIVSGIYLLTGKREAIESIAVLPFENATADPEMEYLCDGITESLINKLSQLPSIKKVIARSSVFRYKGEKKDPQSIGQELDVDAVLVSQLNQYGEELSISAELINVGDNSHIWGNKYRRKASEIFTVEEEISNSITENLKLRLTSEQLKRMAKRPTENAEAYRAYLKGKFYWNKRTKEGMGRSIEYFEKAIEEDPAYAQAYAALASSYCNLGAWGAMAAKEAFPRGKTAALKALEIDNLLAEAHAVLAGVKSDFDWDWEGAERGFKRAIELNPSFATAYQWLGEYLTYMGRFDEAIAEFKRAQELDPLSLMINAAPAWVLYFAGEYEQSEQHCRKTLEMDPDFYPALIYLGWDYTATGRYQEAIDVSQKAIILSDGNTLATSSLIIAYAGLGMHDKAQEILDLLMDQSKHKYVSPFHIAMTYAALNETDKAFEWLGRAHEERFIKIAFLRYGRWFDSLRADPRYSALLKKTNL